MLQESGEMYLETILILQQENGFAHSIEIARILKLSKAAVSKAMTRLYEEGYIEISSEKHISLTEKGKTTASAVYERHVILTDVLLSLGVSKETAELDACRIEHVISKETFEAIKRRRS